MTSLTTTGGRLLKVHAHRVQNSTGVGQGPWVRYVHTWSAMGTDWKRKPAVILTSWTHFLHLPNARTRRRTPQYVHPIPSQLPVRIPSHPIPSSPPPSTHPTPTPSQADDWMAKVSLWRGMKNMRLDTEAFLRRGGEHLPHACRMAASRHHSWAQFTLGCH